MKEIGLLRGMGLCRRYGRMGLAAREALQAARLREMVLWAREHSPFYRLLYRDIGPDFDLKDLPPVDKVQLMDRFDEWLCDPDVKWADLERFMENPDHIGRRFRGKYLVFTTSGSTGNPLVVLYDETANNVMSAMTALRSFARPADMRAFIRRGGKTIGVFATGGFYLSNSSVRARQLSMPWKRNQIAVTSALLPTAQIVSELNAFQPAMLGGYPSNLELLIDEQASGRLCIRPMIIMTGGEYLSESLRGRLADAFHCYVQSSYACTEAGTLACECAERHLHVNDDWVLLEPVDAAGRPVPDGEQAEKLLVTNLFNFTQPFIRYALTDRVVLHREPCACGNPAPWLTLEGRTDDVVRFEQAGVEIRIAPLALYAVLKEVRQVRRFQLVAHPGNRIELRLESIPGADQESAFAQAQAALSPFLAAHGVSAYEIHLSDQLPRPHPVSGKFKHIIAPADA